MGKPSRADLLSVIGELQNLVGRAANAYGNDRNPNRAEAAQAALTRALILCISARAFDPPETGSKSKFIEMIDNT